MSTHTQTLAAVSPNPMTGSILALDLGTTTGWALSPPGGPIASGTVSFRPSRYDGGGMRYLRFRNWLNQLVQGGDVIQADYFEEAPLRRQRQAGPR